LSSPLFDGVAVAALDADDFAWVSYPLDFCRELGIDVICRFVGRLLKPASNRLLASAGGTLSLMPAVSIDGPAESELVWQLVDEYTTTIKLLRIA
jgi:hypothetical protein